MDNSVFTRRTYLRRALLGGGLAWLALFLLCFGIASIDSFGGRPEFWDTLSRTQLSTDEAYLAFGRSRVLANLYQSAAVFALGACLGLSTLPFDETWTQLRLLSWLHFPVTCLCAAAALWFVADSPWSALGIGALCYLAVFLCRWLCWYGEVLDIRRKLRLPDAPPSPLRWRETLPYLPAAALLGIALPLLARLCDGPDVPVFSGLLYPFLLLPIGSFLAGMALGRHRGFCPLFPLACALCYLPMVFLLFNATALFHLLLTAVPALLGNGLAALLRRKREK